MSLLCGYPIGAKAIANSDADVYAATKMFSFCATASPIFMLATVGAKLLRSPVATLIIFISHIFSAVINGLIYRTNNVTKISENKQLFRAGDFGNIITDSALSVISVGGLVALFYMLADMLKSMLPISLSDNLAIAFLIGLLEMTNGIFSVCNIADITTATVLVSALLSFGGMCVLLQCYSYLGQKNVKVADVLKSKFTQCILATLISLCLVKILM